MPRHANPARDRKWLEQRRAGMSCISIARRAHVSVVTVYSGIERARLLERPVGTERLRDPASVPLFPLTPLTPLSQCPHYRPIKRGSVFCCMVCHQSGLDNHTALRRRPQTDPKPERKPAAKPAPKLTRKERRSILDWLAPKPN